MKINETGRYRVTEGEIFIEDPDTGDQMLFLLDRENRLVIRSFMEQDIKPFIARMGGSNSEKRKKMRILYEEIPKEDSWMDFFAVERIVGQEQEDRWDEIYELERIPIGWAAKGEKHIEGIVFTQEEKYSYCVASLVEKLGNYFKIEGQKYVLPC